MTTSLADEQKISVTAGRSMNIYVGASLMKRNDDTEPAHHRRADPGSGRLRGRQVPCRDGLYGR